MLLHEAGGALFSEEYLAPVIAPLVVVSSVLLVRAATQASAASRRRFSVAVRGVLVVGIAATAISGGHSYYLGRPGWRGDPAGLTAVTRCVQRHSKPRDTVFALSLEEVVVQAHRRPAPNVTLGPFSYQDVTTKRARELKILNAYALGALFNRRPPKVLVLTVDDIFETKRAGRFSHRQVTNLAFYGVFRTYEPVCRETIVRHVFKNAPVEVTVYALKP